MDKGAAWSIQVWGNDGVWHWDVRSPSLRCTGERGTWEEAWDTARTEMAEFRAAYAEVS